jgi:hypothetical protein
MVYEDKIDDYLRNKLSEADKSAFETELKGNEELAQEVQFQQSVVDGLRSARKAELKAMLDKVPVGGNGTSGFFHWKYAATLAVIVVALLSVWYFTADNAPEPVEEKWVENANPTQNQDLQADNSEEEVENALPEITPTDAPIEKETIKSPTSRKVKEPKPSTKIEPVKSPGIISGFEKEDEPNEPAVTYSEEAIELGKTSYAVLEVEIDNSDSKFKFHYQFKAGKLVLLGAFDKGLYEILEFNSDGKKTTFLYYKDKFYHLKDNQQKVTALEELQDKVLELKLRDFTGN